MLLAVPVMQAAERWQPRAVWVLIAVFAVLTGVGLVEEYGGSSTVSLVAIYAAANVFFAAYALAARRAVEARARNEALAADLRQANQRLTESSERAQRLGAARERQRLARDLHDSVTQTLFSMTLTAQSALLLLQREPREVPAQLDQIDHLARSALEEMTALGAEPPASAPGGGRLAGALGRHCTERKLAGRAGGESRGGRRRAAAGEAGGGPPAHRPGGPEQRGQARGGGGGGGAAAPAPPATGSRSRTTGAASTRPRPPAPGWA